MSLESLRKKHQELLETQKGGNENYLENYLRLNSGKNEVRILPGFHDDTEDFGSFYSETAIHRIPNEEGGVVNFHCPKVRGERCVVCEFHANLWNLHKGLNLQRGEKSEFGNLATKIKPQPRFYMNVVDRNLQTTDPDACVKIFSTGKKLMALIIDAIFDKDLMIDDDENTCILSTSVGNDFIVDLDDSGIYNNYDKSKPRIKKTPVAETKKELAAIRGQMHDIHNLVREPTDEQTENVMNLLKAKLAEIQGMSVTTPLDTMSSDGKDSDEEFQKRLKV